MYPLSCESKQNWPWPNMFTGASFILPNMPKCLLQTPVSVLAGSRELVVCVHMQWKYGINMGEVSSDLWRCKKSQQNWYRPMYRWHRKCWHSKLFTCAYGVQLHTLIRKHAAKPHCENLALVLPKNNTNSHKICQIFSKMANVSVKTAHYVSANCNTWHTSHWEVQILKKVVLTY